MTLSILLFGGTGMVGIALESALKFRGHRVVAPSRQSFDARFPPRSHEFFSDMPDVVVNATTVKNSINHDAHRVNTEFPLYLARECGEKDIPLIHLSSDGVFAHELGPHYEDSPSTSDTPYGQQKKDGEPSNALVIRFSVVGPELRRFESLLCWFLRCEGGCQGYVDHLWNGLTSLELARVMGDIIEGDIRPGVRHLYSEDVSKYQLLEMLAEAFRVEITIEPVGACIRDQRLATRHPDWLAARRIRPLQQQISELPMWCDDRGHWSHSKSRVK